MITDDERYNAVTAEWRAAREKIGETFGCQPRS